MIKDRITSQIKDKFRESINRTEKTGKEHAFIICKDRKGNLYPRDIYEGEENTIKMESPKSCLPDRAQGNFHTHADLTIAKRLLKEKYQMSLPKEIVISFIEKIAASEAISITTPSHADLINALLNRCMKMTEGTVCVGSDATPNRVDCWTTNNTISQDDCFRARMESTINSCPPKSWIKPLFDKEIINL